MAEPHEPESPAAAFDSAQKAAGAVTDDGRPVIEWQAGDLPRMVDSAEAALMQGHHDILFQRGPQVVRVVRQQAMSVRTFKRPAGGLGISVVDKPYLVEEMTRAAEWKKYDSRSESLKRINAPDIVAQTYLARTGHWKLPKLLSVISTPTLRPDGTILQTPGYDQDTATWYDPCGMDFPKIPEKPNIKQATAAADKLMLALKTLPFVGESDKSVLLSLMLTCLVRRSLPTAPMGGITAPASSSGKTMIADSVSILATGAPASAMQFPSSDEEAEKVALSILMNGAPVVLIDNVVRPLGGAWLCSILTSETHQGRILGRNEMIEVPTTTLWLATGNKLVFEGDMRSRALLCRIDPKHERPQEREFKEDLKDLFTRHRAELVVAGLTLMRAYFVGGERSSVFRECRFKVWSKFCREPLMWLGFKDPLDSYEFIAEEDPELQEHMQMVGAWKDAIGVDKAVTAAEAIKSACEFEANLALREALEQIAKDRAGALSAKRLGAWLRSRDGRIVKGRMFQKAGSNRNDVSLWKLTNVEI